MRTIRRVIKRVVKLLSFDSFTTMENAGKRMQVGHSDVQFRYETEQPERAHHPFYRGVSLIKRSQRWSGSCGQIEAEPLPGANDVRSGYTLSGSEYSQQCFHEEPSQRRSRRTGLNSATSWNAYGQGKVPSSVLMAHKWKLSAFPIISLYLKYYVVTLG